jgi:hypothetical protein
MDDAPLARSTRDEILRFLREPLAFSEHAADPTVWRAALHEVADPLIATHGDWPLRPAQRAAWEGLAGRRAGLILGPPGTGKTHTLSWMAVAYLEARRRASLSCRILVTAFTRNAIGNLLEDVAERLSLLDPSPLLTYVGNPPAGGLPDGVAQAETEDKAVEMLDRDHLVVGCTVWGLHRLLRHTGALTAPVFHLVCIDEASQMVLAQGLMALAGLDGEGRVLVAGDDRQLPPVRIEHEHDIDERRLGSSLYAFLQAAGVPEFPLDETFRLNDPLTRFPRRRFYADRYVSAVPQRRLDLVPEWHDGLDDWERVVLDPDHPVCILVHNGPAAGTSNPFEVHLAVRLAKALQARQLPRPPEDDPSAYWRRQLAIVSPHRAQNAAIRAALTSGRGGKGAVVETVDRIQGRERDAIIVSYTVSDPEFALAEAEFIFSPERLNVASTRARSKLIMIVSRRLLEAVPSDQDLLDDAETLREYVFSTRPVAALPLAGPDGRGVEVQVRVLTFDEAAPLPQLEAPPAHGPCDLPPVDARHQRILDIAANLARASRWGTIADFELARKLAVTKEALFPDIRLLQRHGYLALDQKQGAYGPLWVIRPIDPPRHLFEIEPQTLEARLEEAIAGARPGRDGAFYEKVRDRFDWLDATGGDRLRPVLDELQRAGAVVYRTVDKGLLISLAGSGSRPAEEVPLPIEPATGEDFEVLNCLERLEERRINFGIYEDWHSIAGLANALSRPRQEVAQSVRRLELHGFLLRAEDDRLRSRMAELARTVRYVKQRFRPDDADKRPFLVRNLKVELRDRDKPVRDQSLSDTVRTLAETLGDARATRALAATTAMLGEAWGVDDPRMAGFQTRGLTAIFSAWVAGGDDRFVITADTGSGKTEAACLPLIAGALYDRLAGISGTRTILVYPRVRLAGNQAQRLARYLAALAPIDGAPPLTLGLQNGTVPSTWAHRDETAWEAAGAADIYAFPFFNCPALGCDQSLHLTAGGGHGGADRLSCPSCGWQFDGWIGSKKGLCATPPSLFLPTTESLHQWQHDPRYGALFGDGGTPPRAVLADEIHLYTHIHGAQIGYALRRLLVRAEINGGRCLAIGMSATLGRPAEVWRELVGGEVATTITPTETERAANQRGREYFYFVQPEVESRGRDVAGASTTIQAAMALAHGMRRRTGGDGGFRGIVFVDSIDKMKRLHGNYIDAEEGQRLAALRTRLYPDDPRTGMPRRQCCGQPAGCDLFRDGECWHFAATDARQRTARGRYRPGEPLAVAPTPVFSGSNSRVEPMIRNSDLVFATSSLEVGYDDPEMILVYQHYAPTNLASFIQRKGRGGRGSDDRPVTGVTLSIYSPRDSWYFRRPSQLLDPRSFEVPLNMANHFVRRGQLASLLLDLVARHEARGGQAFDANGRLAAQLTAEAESAARCAFGADVFERLGTDDLAAFWREVWASAGGFVRGEAAKDRRDRLPWVPRTLFGAINLPQVRVSTPRHGGKDEVVDEDIALALGAVAPGNMTRRWGRNEVHWRLPRQGRKPFLSPTEAANAETFSVGGEQAVRQHLPIDAREDLGTQPIEADVLRPTGLSLEIGGLMRGGGWTAFYYLDEAAQEVRRIPEGAVSSGPEVDLRSSATLRGFAIVRPDDRRAGVLPPAALAPLVSRIEVFAGNFLAGRATGLRVARVYWGADAELRLKDEATPYGMNQIFTDPASGRSRLIGYDMETEGVRFHLEGTRLDRFIEAERARLAAAPEDQAWHIIQMLRYIVQRRARNAGINGFEAQRAAELVVAAAGTPGLREELNRLLKMWDPDKLGQLFCRVHADVLNQHPLLSERRIDRLITGTAKADFHKVLRHALKAASDENAIRQYLRSLVLHGLAIRFRHAFVLHGRGDEGRVVCHVKLPIQFGNDACDVITIAENGEGGDGTTRTFVQSFEAAAAQMMDGFLTSCPNAAEDALIETAAGLAHRHADWRAANPRDPATLERLAAALGADLSAEDVPLQALFRLFYGVEAVGPEEFALYDLWQEVRQVEAELRTRMRRRPAVWELTSAAVQGASAGERPHLQALLAAYGRIEEAVQEDSLSPEARLADQVYRISGRLCVDGCPACLHGDSDLMPSGLVEASVSRRVLERFVAM